MRCSWRRWGIGVRCLSTLTKRNDSIRVRVTVEVRSRRAGIGEVSMGCRVWKSSHITGCSKRKESELSLFDLSKADVAGK